MLHRIISFKWLALLLILALAVLAKTRLSGDGGEYLLMSHAMLKHGSAAIRASDLDAFLHRPEGEQQLGISQTQFSAVRAQFDLPKPAPAGGFFPTGAGKFYAIHFWLYSLLALPFYALLSACGLNLLWAFSLLNLAFAGATLAYLRRVMPEHGSLAGALFLAAGTTFYLTWTGPEVMTASCALVASIAILRGNTGLAMLLSGLGASQNPSLIGIMPLALAYRPLLAKWPQLAWPGAAARPWSRGQVALALAGVALALAPYLFFQLTFGTPSLIARYATDQGLISAGRLWSLFFDLDQGMLAGLPGLLLELPMVALVLAGGQRRRWLVNAALLAAAVLLMALPALSTTNWNSGCAVLMRYSYWLAMPLLALFLLGLADAPDGGARRLAWPALALQGLLMVQFGVLGEQASHLRHTPLVRWVLAHFPQRYHPEAEIFFERGGGQEMEMPLELAYVYRQDGRPLTLMRHWSNPAESGGLCPAGTALQGLPGAAVGGGWQYWHAPFRCGPAAGGAQAGVWRVKAGNPDALKLLGGGWSTPEEHGVWSEGAESGLTVPVPAGTRVRRLRVRGWYYGLQNRSGVTVNGRDMGNVNLAADGVITLAHDLPQDGVLTIRLRHPGAVSPKSRGESADARLLGFHLQAIGIDTIDK